MLAGSRPNVIPAKAEFHANQTRRSLDGLFRAISLTLARLYRPGTWWTHFTRLLRVCAGRSGSFRGRIVGQKEDVPDTVSSGGSEGHRQTTESLAHFLKTPAAPASKDFFQAWIWPGWTSYRAASWATVSSPFSASRAILALKVGLCFLRFFFVPLLLHSNSCGYFRSRTLT